MIVGPILAVIIFVVIWRKTGDVWQGLGWAGAILGALVGAFMGGFGGFFLGAVVGAVLALFVPVLAAVLAPFVAGAYVIEATQNATGINGGLIFVAGFYGLLVVSFFTVPVSHNDPESIADKIRKRFAKGG